MSIFIEFIFAVAVLVSFHSQASFVPMFNGLNFSDWCGQVQFHLGIMDLDLALQVEKPTLLLIKAKMRKKLPIEIGKDRID